jgi:hypothetical protein
MSSDASDSRKEKAQVVWSSVTYISTKFGKNRPVVSKVGNVATKKIVRNENILKTYSLNDRNQR